MRINIGCGQTPTKGWRNYDNSMSLRLSRYRYIPEFLRSLHILSSKQYEFVCFARKNDIRWGDATKGLSLQKNSCEIVYSSHMLEHLDRLEASEFLTEAFRILKPSGIVRLALPDLKITIAQYNEDQDADAFIEGTRMCVDRPRSFLMRLRILFVGTRHHQWLYDGASLCRLLEKHGFVDVEILPPGETRIRESGSLNLQERREYSVYVEATKPTVD